LQNGKLKPAIYPIRTLYGFGEAVDNFHINAGRRSDWYDWEAQGSPVWIVLLHVHHQVKEEQ
jgi:hypothetical protein